VAVDRKLILTGVAILLSGCTAMSPQEAANRVDFGGSLEFGLPVTSMIGRRFETVIRQQYDFSCGSAALATLLRYHYGEPQTEQTAFIGMFRDGDQEQIRRLGFSLLDMKRYLAGRKVAADGYRVTIDQIASARIPGIALVDFNGYKHFVVIKGIEGGSVLLGDPSLGLRRQPIRAFTKQWNGVFFVLNERNAIGQAHFNHEADLDRAPAGRMFAPSDPLSVAELALTRPLFNEI
jgi:predicted double-glycine peptidase